VADGGENGVDHIAGGSLEIAAVKMAFELQWVASAGGSVWVSITTRSVLFIPAVGCAMVTSYRAGDRHKLPA
jgi:hypothetical protein